MNDQKEKELYILWLTDRKIYEENNTFLRVKNKFPTCEPKIYYTINTMIQYIETNIYFINTYIIITDVGTLYKDFIEAFTDKMKAICVIPKFIIYSRDNSIHNNSGNHSFYNYGGKHSSFDDIFTFIQNDQIIQNIDISSINETLKIKSKLWKNKDQDIKLCLDPIESFRKMYLPSYFRTMVKVKKTDINKFDKFTKDLYQEYKDDKRMKNLLSQIIKIKNIPIELYCKYWLRVYTAPGFHYKMNDILNQGKSGKYTLFIKMMYEGLRIKALESPIKDILYRGACLENIELERINDYLKKKKKDLAAGILFCRAFLSFSQKEESAIKFAINAPYFNPNTMKRVLFILKSNKKENTIFNTHADIEKYSFFPKEKEILFFPYSCFDIVNCQNAYLKDHDFIRIELNYISSYDERLRKNYNLDCDNKNDTLIDSEYEKKLDESHILDQDLDKSSISSIMKLTNSFIEENNNLIENSKIIHKQKIEDIMKEISDDYISSKESFEISGQYNSKNSIINYPNQNQVYINPPIMVNPNQKKFNYKLLFCILGIITVVLIIVITSVVVTRKKKDKSDKNLKIFNSVYSTEKYSSDEIINTYVNENSYIIRKTYIIENSNISNEIKNSFKNDMVGKTNINSENSNIINNSDIIDKLNINDTTNEIGYSNINHKTPISIIENSITIKKTNIITHSETINTSVKIKDSSQEYNKEDLYPYFDEYSEEYEIASLELEQMNNFRKSLGLKELKLDLELTNLVYDDIINIFYTSTLNIGGMKNNKGEDLGQYILIHTSNNTCNTGFATKSWYESRKGNFDENDCFISDEPTSYGFGVICVSDGCIAMAYFYPSSSGYGLVN